MAKVVVVVEVFNLEPDQVKSRIEESMWCEVHSITQVETNVTKNYAKRGKTTYEEPREY